VALLLFAALGCGLGYRFHITRHGYAVLALMALIFPLLQIADVVLVRDRSAQTMLPLVVGLTMILSTVVGAGARIYSTRQ
jgi:hypothetical protein